VNVVVRSSIQSPSRIDGLPQQVFLRNFQPLRTRDRIANSICSRRFPVSEALDERLYGNDGNIEHSRRLICCLECRVMNTPDPRHLGFAVVDARSILSEHVAFGSRNPAQALERLWAVLDRAELIHALNRMNRKPVARLKVAS
jgi:hypothetical protein